MKEYLFGVSMRDKRTGDKIELRVWGETSTDATHKVTEACFGAYGEYTWLGTGPIYQNNKNIEREKSV